MRKILLTTLLLITMSNSIGKSFDDLVTAADIKTAVKELATAGDWAKLTQLEAFLNHEDKLTDSGYPMVDAYYVGFRDYIDSQKNGADGFALLEKKMSEWVRKFPDSPASHIALSEVLNKKD